MMTRAFATMNEIDLAQHSRRSVIQPTCRNRNPFARTLGSCIGLLVHDTPGPYGALEGID